jgi:hypothetical protein
MTGVAGHVKAFCAVYATGMAYARVLLDWGVPPWAMWPLCAGVGAVVFWALTDRRPT